MSSDSDVDLARPGRPKDPAKRSAILTAARRLFLKEGYDRVSLDAVAAEAGVSKVTIYSHFPNKEALFIAALSLECEATFQRATATAEEGAPFEAVLVELSLSFLDMLMDPEVDAMHAVMAAEGERRPELPRLFFETVVQRSSRQLADIIARERDRGTISCRDPAIAAVQFLAMVQGDFVFHHQIGLGRPDQAQIEAYVRDCAALMIRAWSTR